MPAIEMNAEFKRAITLMRSADKPLFITGKAGTGKSTLLEHFCQMSTKKPVVLAPTGVAALNVKGQTIHSFFNFYVDVTPESIRSKDTRPRDPDLYHRIKTIIIDEVSMLRADLLDCIDVFLRMYGPHKGEAFGGVHMVFIGDLYQLPPVVTSEERDVFSQHYATPYFFSAHALEGMDLEMVELEKIYRQKDREFIDLLNRIRNNSVEAEDIAHLNSRYTDHAIDDMQGVITLTTTNRNADAVNEAHLEALPGKMHRSKAKVEGEFGKEYYPTAPELSFKVGAQIMLLNNEQKRRWVNGSIGVIEAVRHDAEGNEYVRVRLSHNDRVVSVKPHIWEVFKFRVEEDEIISEPAGIFAQYPFRLAWGITIHKSQGKTFERVVIDIGRGTFAAGQIYVALSRCTSFEGVRLKTPVEKRHIRTDARIFKFLTRLHYRIASETFPLEKKYELIRNAIEHKLPIEMVYLKANDTKSERSVLPLRVGKEQYQGKHFPGMVALCQESNELRMFHVGRILTLKLG